MISLRTPKLPLLQTWNCLPAANCFGLIATLVLATLLTLPAGISRPASSAEAAPFTTLLGSWRGIGNFTLDSGERQRISCNAYYTGGSAQMNMAIRCSGEKNRIEIRSKLAFSSGRISGSWEERTYNASGTVSGSASPSLITLAIAGSTSGSMSVKYGKSRHQVTIRISGSGLKSVSISLARG